MNAPPDAAGSDQPPRLLAPPHVRRPLLRGGLVLAAVIVIYYAVPVGRIESDAGVALSAVGLLVGVGVLGWLLVRQLRVQLRARADESVSIQSLLVLAYVVVPMFALGYVALERADPDQFVELETKTDGLYFAVSTLATVGFGDVAARGQLARALVTIQIAFDLVFVAALGSLVTRQVRRRMAAVPRTGASGDASGAPAAGTTGDPSGTPAAGGADDPSRRPPTGAPGEGATLPQADPPGDTRRPRPDPGPPGAEG